MMMNNFYVQGAGAVLLLNAAFAMAVLDLI
jgi:hypothetical protein